MKAIVQDTYGKAAVSHSATSPGPVQDTYDSAVS